MAALCLQCVIFGAAMKPVTAKDSKAAAVELDDIDVEKKKVNTNSEEAAFVNVADMEIQEEANKEVVKEKGGVRETLETYKNLMKNVPFLLIMVGNLPAVMGLYIPYVYLPSVRFILTLLLSRKRPNIPLYL